MQPRVVTVGPLAAAAANNVALVQAPRAAGALALNGSASNAVANNIALSQTVAGASALVLNGSLSRGVPAVAWLSNSRSPQNIYITSAGNDSGITFNVVGLDICNVVMKESLQGANVGVVASTKKYFRILSIASSGSTAAAVTAGTNGIAALDQPRKIIFTSSGNDSALTITLVGTDFAGDLIMETLAAGAAAAVQSSLDYKTVSQILVSGATAGTIEVGTNGVACSQWLFLDTWALGSLSGQCVVSGTVNYTVEATNDDPDSFANPVAAPLVTWDDDYAGLNGAQASAQFGLQNPPQWIRVKLNSGTGSVRMTIIQHGSVTY